METRSALEQRDKVAAFQRKHRIRLLTLLFTDMVESTALKAKCGDAEAVGVFEKHHKLIRDIRAQFEESDEIETAGDSFFLVFAKPSDAVRFSLLVQAQLRSLAAEMGLPIRDRIGIHVGEVYTTENETTLERTDLFGLQVDSCARLASLAGADQILVSRAAFDNARQVLKRHEIFGAGTLSWLSHGTYLLKGLEEPVEICEVGETAHAALKPPPDSEKAHRTISTGAEEIPGWRPAVGEVTPKTQWILERKLGEGGFGEVWQAWHPVLKEKRVFKFCFQAERARSLKREVALFRMIRDKVGNHDNLVRLFEVNFNEAPYYLEAEYVEGRDLKMWCEALGGCHRLPLLQRLDIVAQAAEGLEAAHDLGIIHRDIKPSNVLIREMGNQPIRVKIADFGIGKIVGEEMIGEAIRMGFTQTVLAERKVSASGTLGYAAPELLSGVTASSQSDVYSLGVLLYQMIVGDFNKPLTIDWSREIENTCLRRILQRCCAGNPQQRFVSAGELAKELRALLEKPRRLNLGLTVFREQSRHRKLALLGCVFAIAAITALFISRAGVGERLELGTYDWRMRWAKRQMHDKAADLRSIFIDTRAFQEILRALSEIGDRTLSGTNTGTWPWPRFVYGRLVRELKAQGAIAVAFDILFMDRRDKDLVVELTSGKRIDSDEFFAQEMGRARNVILGAEGSTRQERVWPAELFRTNAWDLGAISFDLDQDGVMRRMPAFVDAGNRRIWNIGLLLAAKGLGLDLENATVEARQIIFRGSNGLVRTIPIHGQEQMLPVWDLSWPEIRKQSETSLANLLALDYGRQKLGGGLSQGFHNKLVMIGSASVGPASEGMIVDSFQTPLGQIPGMAAYLNVANSLLADRFVRPYTQVSLLTTIALCTGLTVGLLWRGPDWKSSTRVLALLAVIWIAAYALMGGVDYWLPLVAPSLAVVIALGLLRIYCSVVLARRAGEKLWTKVANTRGMTQASAGLGRR